MDSFTISSLVENIKVNIASLNRDEITIIKNDLDNIFRQRLFEYDNEIKNKLKQEEDKVNEQLEQLNEQVKQLETKKKELTKQVNDLSGKETKPNSYVEKAKKNIIQTVKANNTNNFQVVKSNKSTKTKNTINYNNSFVVLCKVNGSTYNIPAYMVVETENKKTRLPNRDDIVLIKKHFNEDGYNEYKLYNINVIILNIVIQPHPAQLCISRNVEGGISYHWNRFTTEEFNEEYYDSKEDVYYPVPKLDNTLKRCSIIEPILKSEKMRDLIGMI